MVTGAHTIIYTRDPEADRAFFREVLGFEHVDAGGGWLIFALPPGEIACHPSDQDSHQLCRLTSIRLPGGGELGLYEPRHPIAPH